MNKLRPSAGWRRPICLPNKLIPACPKSLHVLRKRKIICARGAVLVLPGFLNSSKSYHKLVQSLRARNYAADVVPVSTKDWIPILAGANFEFYLQRLDAALQVMHSTHGSVALVGHSAGGWIARILLGDVPYQGNIYGRRELVHTLVTLGTPHHSTEQYPLGRIPEKLSIEGGNVPPEVYGSSLKFANYFYPRGDAFPGVQVVCLVGNAIVGRDLLAGDEAQQAQEGSVNRVQASGKLDAYFAFQGYKSGCGRGDVPGDGVTPIEIAHLPGAENVVLEGVWHGPQGSVERPWYGDVLHLWEKYLVPGYTSP